MRRGQIRILIIVVSLLAFLGQRSTFAVIQPKIYWADVVTNKIERSNLDGTEREVIVYTGLGWGGPRGLAIDAISGKMYWSDWTNDKFRRANLDGSEVEDLKSTWSIDISLDLVHNKMYWTDPSWGGYKIKRANLDGSGLEVLLEQFVDDIYCPLGFALDASRGNMYWSELLEGSIKRANLDGSEITTIISFQ